MTKTLMMKETKSAMQNSKKKVLVGFPDLLLIGPVYLSREIKAAVISCRKFLCNNSELWSQLKD